MANQVRDLQVTPERCIGCRACATVCPAGLITLTDSESRRVVRFASVCDEECDRCAAACPTQAIRLAPPAGAAGEGIVLEFPLLACEGCNSALAPAETLAHLRATIPGAVQVDAEGESWLALCPACRQEREARRMARETLMTRWPV